MVERVHDGVVVAFWVRLGWELACQGFTNRTRDVTQAHEDAGEANQAPRSGMRTSGSKAREHVGMVAVGGGQDAE